VHSRKSQYIGIHPTWINKTNIIQFNITTCSKQIIISRSGLLSRSLYPHTPLKLALYATFINPANISLYRSNILLIVRLYHHLNKYPLGVYQFHYIAILLNCIPIHYNIGLRSRFLPPNIPQSPIYSHSSK